VEQLEQQKRQLLIGAFASEDGGRGWIVQGVHLVLQPGVTILASTHTLGIAGPSALIYHF
jgi:hypothetical protein